ncbi:hypothetical protein BDK51DRAFT_31654 [Blyttiomyces helicus]|uniref:Uncharacterized protein n=1 Tax=Blyttiomyces helicus TaxID=388810 RepID=A0A4P9WD89_9FUNG|nr:hypothetical protein BDK51DRAFT_31654 [Blyttiomyces helicus]|eukprot:RKO88910.1 hypothetical protein BDK51DRAFT_31654 [Blyttiomyces helicus]
MVKTVVKIMLAKSCISSSTTAKQTLPSTASYLSQDLDKVDGKDKEHKEDKRDKEQKEGKASHLEDVLTCAVVPPAASRHKEGYSDGSSSVVAAKKPPPPSSSTSTSTSTALTVIYDPCEGQKKNEFQCGVCPKDVAQPIHRHFFRVLSNMQTFLKGTGTDVPDSGCRHYSPSYQYQKRPRVSEHEEARGESCREAKGNDEHGGNKDEHLSKRAKQDPATNFAKLVSPNIVVRMSVHGKQVGVKEGGKGPTTTHQKGPRMSTSMHGTPIPASTPKHHFQIMEEFLNCIWREGGVEVTRCKLGKVRQIAERCRVVLETGRHLSQLHYPGCFGATTIPCPLQPRPALVHGFDVHLPTLAASGLVTYILVGENHLSNVQQKVAQLPCSPKHGRVPFKDIYCSDANFPEDQHLLLILDPAQPPVKKPGIL